jgi:futalosine hydrolase
MERANVKALLVTATAFELEPALSFFNCHASATGGLGVPGTVVESESFDCLVTGVGQLQCAAHLMSQLAEKSYRFVLQAGIAGSFSSLYPKGSVVRVVEEGLGDFGAEADGGFIDVVDMGLLPTEGTPFKGGVLSANEPSFVQALNLPAVRSITVNRTLAEPKSIEWVRQRYSPDIVNMEGAALFYVCRLKGVPFIQLRAISDMVGPRDKASWDIPGATKALCERVIELLNLAG